DHPPLAEGAEGEALMPAAPAPTRSGRWYERFQGAAAAVVILFALFRGPGLFLQTVSTQGEGGSAKTSLDVAYSSFNLLVADLKQGSPSEVLIRDAGDLRAALAAAMTAGADVRDLNAEIASQVPPLLSNVPPATATAIVAALGGLVDNPSSGPEPSASPSPSESPSPSPSESPSPSPSESSSAAGAVQQAQGADAGGPGGTPPDPTLAITLVFAVLPASSWLLRANSRNLS